MLMATDAPTAAVTSYEFMSVTVGMTVGVSGYWMLFGNTETILLKGEHSILYIVKAV